ncbi:MAG: hypothetical protein SOY65_05205 [Marinifilaceae bacterium]|nr:hypothetical protein [Marinifilaceae bacterium]
MKKTKFLITLTLVVIISFIYGISHAVIFKDCGVNSSILYIAFTEDAPGDQSSVTFTQGKDYEGVIGFRVDKVTASSTLDSRNIR